MTNKQGPAQRHAMLLELVVRLCDALWIATALVACSWLWAEPWAPHYSWAAAAGAVVFALIAQLHGLYQAFRTARLESEVLRVWAAWGTVLPLLLLTAFGTLSVELFSRGVMASWFGLTPVLISIWRLSLRMSLRELRARGRNTRLVAIAGLSEVGLELAQTIAATPWMGLRMVGFYDDRSAKRLGKLARQGELAGRLTELVQRAREGEVDSVYIALPLRAEPRMQALVAALADTTASVHLACDFGGFDPLQARWSTVGDVPVMSVIDRPFSGVEGWLKRSEDLLLGLLLTLLAVVPMLLIAVAVKLTSRGPALVRERRYRSDGEKVDLLRFRTGEFDTNATVQTGPATPMGRWLVALGLDRLPQLFHVLSGKMSLVGPLPLHQEGLETYRAVMPESMQHHRVRPGLTDWAQVHGIDASDSKDTLRQRAAYDLAYLRHWAVSLDLKIVLLVLSGRVRRSLQG